MESSEIILIAILTGCLGVCLLLLSVYFVFYRCTNRPLRGKRIVVASIEDRVAALSGNLVREVTNIPINEVYTASKILLGRGSSAQVIVGEHNQTKRRYAIKVIDSTKRDVIQRYEKEKYYLRDIDHTNVVRLYEVYTSKQGMYFVMELCTGGHLGELLHVAVVCTVCDIVRWWF
jgi:hypothetical protein